MTTTSTVSLPVLQAVPNRFAGCHQTQEGVEPQSPDTSTTSRQENANYSLTEVAKAMPTILRLKRNVRNSARKIDDQRLVVGGEVFGMD